MNKKGMRKVELSVRRKAYSISFKQELKQNIIKYGEREQDKGKKKIK